MFGWLRRPQRTAPHRPRLLAIAYALHQPEAEMLVDILRQHGIPAFFRRALGIGDPFPAGGARVLLVPAERALEARALLDSLEAGDEATRVGQS
jgi:hypothetical protein